MIRRAFVSTLSYYLDGWSWSLGWSVDGRRGTTWGAR